MEDGKAEPPGPDLTRGIASSDLPDQGKLLGHVVEEPVLLVRRGAEVFAIGAVCTHLSADDSPPVDRPNLSKDYLAGAAPEDWLPLRPPEFYRDNGIDLRLGAIVDRIDLASREVRVAGGESVPFDRLLLATGAEPVRPSIPGASTQIFVLRSLADCRAIIERARTAKTVLVLGASFIGLEVAAALRAREIEVHVA